MINRKSAERALLVRGQLVDYLAQMKLVQPRDLDISSDLKIGAFKNLMLTELKIMKGNLNKNGSYHV
jgi:hypothetical protein